MACEYYSQTVFAEFTDRATLDKALKRLNPEISGRVWIMTNGRVEAANQSDLNAVKQAYQVEASKAALKKKGFFVSETQDQNTGKIRLTVRA